MTNREAKTPAEYIAALDEPRRSDIQQLFDFICQTLPNEEPSRQLGMIGWGSYHYTYASGKEGEWPIIALASQKNYISVYASAADDGQYVPQKYAGELPKANIGKSCIRFKKVSDINLLSLKKIVLESIKVMK